MGATGRGGGCETSDPARVCWSYPIEPQAQQVCHWRCRRRDLRRRGACGLGFRREGGRLSGGRAAWFWAGGLHFLSEYRSHATRVYPALPLILVSREAFSLCLWRVSGRLADGDALSAARVERPRASVAYLLHPLELVWAPQIRAHTALYLADVCAKAAVHLRAVHADKHAERDRRPRRRRRTALSAFPVAR